MYTQLALLPLRMVISSIALSTRFPEAFRLRGLFSYSDSADKVALVHRGRHALNIRAQRLQFADNILIAAVDIVDFLHHRRPGGGKAGEHQRGAGAQVGRFLMTAPVSRGTPG